LHTLFYLFGQWGRGSIKDKLPQNLMYTWSSSRRDSHVVLDCKRPFWAL